MGKNISFYKYKKFVSLMLSVIVFASFFAAGKITALADTDYEAEMEERKTLEIQSNNIEGWPTGPSIGAEAAILVEANTGTILYAKNIDEELYPASTTKIMTCLLAAENGNLSDMVTFSYDAVHSVPSDGSNIGIDAGESMTLEECMYGVMVGSANECANAVAEHIGGSIDDFVDMMNAKVEELGLSHTHFVNSNGLFDENHYTSAYDLAMIACEFFDNDILLTIGNTARYHFVATSTQPDDFYINNKHKLINGEIEYEGILGGKTGYTDEARNTLVTCAEQGGMKLVCVILKEESPYQFTDTATLFDYGFNNFSKVSLSSDTDLFTVDSNTIFTSGSDIFGLGEDVITIDDNSFVILPSSASIEDCDYSISYDDDSNGAVITFTYNGQVVGSSTLIFGENDEKTESFENIIYINVIYVIAILIIFIIVTGIISKIAGVFLQTRYLEDDPKRRMQFRRRKKTVKKRRMSFNKKKRRNKRR